MNIQYINKSFELKEISFMYNIITCHQRSLSWCLNCWCFTFLLPASQSKSLHNQSDRLNTGPSPPSYFLHHTVDGGVWITRPAASLPRAPHILGLLALVNMWTVFTAHLYKSNIPLFNAQMLCCLCLCAGEETVNSLFQNKNVKCLKLSK